MSSSMLLSAVQFAIKAHKDQKRKYTQDPYVVHCIEVARIVSTRLTTVEPVIAALLHDTLEDTDVTSDDIRKLFGEHVVLLVEQCSDISRPEDGNRATRKAIDREWYAKGCAEAQTIKLADLIDNSRSITTYDRGFAKVYMEEKKKLVDKLHLGDEVLRNEAYSIITQWEQGRNKQ